MKKTGYLVLFAFLLTLLYSSCRVRKHPFSGVSNPTEYTYHMPLEELRTLIINDFENQTNPDIEEISCRKMEVSTITKYLNGLTEDTISNPWYPKEKKSVHDLILIFPISTKATTLGYSDVYYKKNMPLLYNVYAFHLNFEEIDAKKTKMRVHVLHPEVATGKEIWGMIILPSHAGYRWKSVEPTTIEEYKILLRIGKLAGEKNMPQLKRPDSGYHVPRWP